MTRCALLVLVMLATSLTAETHVISVGVSATEGNCFPVPFADDDARRVAEAFVKAGVPEANIRILTSDNGDPRLQPSRERILEYEFDRLAQVSRDGDTIVFFFAGHGVFDGSETTQSDASGLLAQAGDLYLITANVTDASLETVRRRALSLSALNQALARVKKRQALLLFDACAETLTRSLRPKLVSSTNSAFLACQIGEQAHADPGLKSGVFTHFLVEKLTELHEAAESGIQLKQLYEQVKTAVGDWSARSGKRQVPELLPPSADFELLRRFGQIMIRCTEKDARIFCDGSELGTANNIHKLPVGNHLIKIQKEGFKPIEATIKVDARQLIQTERYKPEPQPAELVVAAEPSARILVDGEQREVSPCVLSLAPGSYVIRAEAEEPGYLPQEKSVELTAAKRSEVSFQLTRAMGHLLVRSTPVGAKVTIDQRPGGETPYEVLLAAGRHVVQVEAPGYRPYRQEVELRAGETAQQVQAELALLPVNIRLVTEPAGAKVFLNGSAQPGVTPCALEVTPGEVTLRAELDGYLTEEQALAIMPGQGAPELQWKLSPRPDGWVEVATNPPGAAIRVGQRELGHAPQRLSLPAGEYDLEARLDGYEPGTAKVAVRSGEAAAPVQLTLAPRPALLVITTTPAGAAVLLNGKPTEFRTPCEVPVPPGEVKVELRLAGRETVEEIHRCRPGERVGIERELLPPAPGEVLVQSSPSGASISANGRALGQTPQALKLPPGKYALKLELAGHQPLTVPVTLLAKQKTPPVEARLVPLPARVTVVSNPPGATLWLDGREAGERTPATVDLPAGTPSRLRAELPGRPAIEVEVVPAPGEERTLTLDLPEPLPGQVEVNTLPSGAAIQLDGQTVGIAPLVLKLPPGEHRLQASLDGYEAAVQTINVAAGQAPAAVKLELVVLPVTVKVASRPEGARVLLNGQPTGQVTPCELSVPPGELKLRLSAAGHEELEQTVLVAPGRPISVAWNLAELLGELLITSEPSGATVLQDGRAAGQTPLTLRLKPGPIELGLRRAGHRDQSLSAVVEAGATKRLSSGAWEALPGRIRVATNPPGAAVSVNGAGSGQVTPCEVSAPAGSATVELTLNGYRPHRATVTVQADGSVALPETTLVREGAPTEWPVRLNRYQAPPGVQVRLVKPDDMPQVLIPAGAFTMGSKDGDADERPAKKIAMSAFWMDLHEVTVGQYAQFCIATGRRMPAQPRGSELDLPVVNVRYEEAAAYAAWVGRALPSEAQWERAARGGLEGARFPWGNEPPDTQKACFSLDPKVPGQPRAVGHGAPNAFGLLDMAGNVAEWCRDRYQEGWYGRMPGADPVQEKTEEVRIIQVPAMGSDGVPTTVKATAPLRYAVVRGGSWASSPDGLRVADRQRQLLNGWDETIGFRLISPAN